jgi:protein gp37
VGERSLIEWTDATWNPVRGCTRVSEGCRHCYAEAIAARFSGPGLPYEGLARPTPDGPRWTGEVRLIEEHLEDPLRWKTPQHIFVNSMSDLFHEKLSDEQIDRVFAVMLRAPRHAFQILTKRPERMRAYMAASFVPGGILTALGEHLTDPGVDPQTWPPANVWLGTSVENPVVAATRIPELLLTQAAVRFLSVEPLLARVDLRPWLHGLHWVIVGGESGLRARPMHPAWAREIRDACVEKGVPFFFKQWGEYEPVRPLYGGDEEKDEGRGQLVPVCTQGHMWAENLQPPLGTELMERRGKRSSGRWLDGRTWDEFPMVIERVPDITQDLLRTYGGEE